MGTQYRQGDVLLEWVDAIPADAAKAKRDRRGVVLAEGEATGHAHRFDSPAVALYETPARERFVVIEGGKAAALLHEEHTTVELPPGSYRVRRQREYAPTEIRTVAD